MAKEAEKKKAADNNSPAPGESFSKIEEELEDDDGLEEEEDEDEDEAPARSLKPGPHGHGTVAPSKADDAADPTWWIPHAVLGTLVMVGVLGFFGAFTSLLKPQWDKVKRSQPATSASVSAGPSAAAPAASAPTKPIVAPTAPRPAPTAAPKVVDPNPSFGARRILVTYKGAKNSSKEEKRSKEDAKKRADDAAKKLAGGAKFEEVAGEFSDEPGAKGTGGNMGRFKRDAFDPAIIGVVEKLQVGATSPVFESPFGYEILMRLE